MGLNATVVHFSVLLLISYFTIFLGRDHSRGFYLAFPSKIALTPQGREPMWRFYQLPSISLPIMHSETGKKKVTGWVLGPTGCTG